MSSTSRSPCGLFVNAFELDYDPAYNFEKSYSLIFFEINFLIDFELIFRECAKGLTNQTFQRAIAQSVDSILVIGLRFKRTMREFKKFHTCECNAHVAVLVSSQYLVCAFHLLAYEKKLKKKHIVQCFFLLLSGSSVRLQIQ